MGIDSLWDILDDIKEKKSLASFRGKKLAVDFSSWFVKCENVGYVNRSIFFRIVDLMSNGITPIFVFDSLRPPEFKSRKRGISYSDNSLKWKEPLEEMGFQVIRASGEAEKTCAQLNYLKVVDGCITDDGDCLAYGARTVLKDYEAKSKAIHVYEASDIEEKLGLCREEFIAAAILIGCDYCEGVPSVGKETFIKLVEELKKNGVTDVLDRIRKWKENSDLLSMMINEEKNKTRKPAHCHQCHHLGTLRKHDKDGCSMCGDSSPCYEQRTESIDYVPCSCEFHAKESEMNSFTTELKVCKAALKQENFPYENIILEFQGEDEGISNNIDVQMKMPNYNKVKELLTGKFKIDQSDVKHLFPALVKMTMYGQVIDVEFKPIPIEFISKCIKNKEPCYRIKFQRNEWDTFTPATEDGYVIEVPRSIFDSKFPDFPVSESGEEQKSKTKAPKEAQVQASTSQAHERTKKNEANDNKITNYFKKGKGLSSINKTE